MVYWYSALLAPAADAQILRGLEKCRGHRQAIQLRTQAVDDLSGADLALRERLERQYR